MKKRSSKPPTSRKTAVGMTVAAPVAKSTSLGVSNSAESTRPTSRLYPMPYQVREPST